ncbi:hypothetical protein PR048_022559 [Dryococelus australis]|uniref:Uncharacterized protein n=1 Tax=Dryococelus australis TaxID=614101 RepID=A0ABQ9H1F7_9NEOP|nr:hypothetical protein PR048_022559 [Dryococelus australis]
MTYALPTPMSTGSLLALEIATESGAKLRDISPKHFHSCKTREEVDRNRLWHNYVSPTLLNSTRLPALLRPPPSLSNHFGEPSSNAGGIAPGFSRVGIVLDDAAIQRVFSGISLFFLPSVHSDVAPAGSAWVLFTPLVVSNLYVVSPADQACHLHPFLRQQMCYMGAYISVGASNYSHSLTHSILQQCSLQVGCAWQLLCAVDSLKGGSSVHSTGALRERVDCVVNTARRSLISVRRRAADSATPGLCSPIGHRQKGVASTSSQQANSAQQASPAKPKRPDIRPITVYHTAACNYATVHSPQLQKRPENGPANSVANTVHMETAPVPQVDVSPDATQQLFSQIKNSCLAKKTPALMEMLESLFKLLVIWTDPARSQDVKARNTAYYAEDLDSSPLTQNSRTVSESKHLPAPQAQTANELDLRLSMYGNMYGSMYDSMNGSMYGNMYGSMYISMYGNMHGSMHGSMYGSMYDGMYGTMHDKMYGSMHDSKNAGKDMVCDVMCNHQLGAAKLKQMPSIDVTVHHEQHVSRVLDFRMWESCQTMPLVGGVSRGSPFYPAVSFRLCSILTSVTLIGSQDLNVKSRPNLFTSLHVSYIPKFKVTHWIAPEYIHVQITARSVDDVLTRSCKAAASTTNGTWKQFSSCWEGNLQKRVSWLADDTGASYTQLQRRDILNVLTESLPRHVTLSADDKSGVTPESDQSTPRSLLSGHILRHSLMTTIHRTAGRFIRDSSTSVTSPDRGHRRADLDVY